MPSFDVVSEVNMHEFSNAMDQSRREISTRYDFKKSDVSIESTGEDSITLVADNEFQVQQMRDIVYNKLVKRGIDILSMEAEGVERRGTQARQKINMRQGIDKDTGRKIVKLIKESKLKVQSAIQDEQVRVTGKKRDDLQKVMTLLRSSALEIPVQFTNFRD